MVQKRRKVVLHSQAHNFVVRLRKYFCLENQNNGPLLPLDRVCERVAAALYLSTESVVRITENNRRNYKSKLSLTKQKSFTQNTFSTKLYSDNNKYISIESKTIKIPTTDNTKIEKTREQGEIRLETCDPILRSSLESPNHQDQTKNKSKYEHNEFKIEHYDFPDENTIDFNNTEYSKQDIKKECQVKKNKINNKKTQYDKSGNFILTGNSMATCKICFKTVIYRTRNSHIRKYHPTLDSRSMVKCELCDQLFIDNRLDRHVKLMHGKTRSKCAFCSTDFSSQDNLKKHVSSCTRKIRKRVVRPVEIEVVQCEMCGKEMQRASLKLHMKKIHLGIAPVCEHCGKKFGNRGRLMDHCRAKHDYEKLKCTRCDFKSSSQIALDNHIRKHDGIKPFICDQCGAGFHGAYLLHQHHRVHIKFKEFKCDLCPSAFKSKNSLTSHKASCHDIKSYSCSCGKRFSSENYAKRHLKKQTIGKHELEKIVTIQAVPFDKVLD